MVSCAAPRLAKRSPRAPGSLRYYYFFFLLFLSFFLVSFFLLFFAICVTFRHSAGDFPVDGNPTANRMGADSRRVSAHRKEMAQRIRVQSMEARPSSPSGSCRAAWTGGVLASRGGLAAR